MNQSTSSAQVATNLLNVLQGYTKGIRFLLVMFLTLTASTAWGATHTWSDRATSTGNSQQTITIERGNGTVPTGATITQVDVTYDFTYKGGSGSISVTVGSESNSNNLSSDVHDATLSLTGIENTSDEVVVTFKAGQKNQGNQNTLTVTEIVVTYTVPASGGDVDCNNIDVSNGSTIILPSNSTTYAANDWENAGAPTAYADEATKAIGTNNYCVTFTQAADHDSGYGLQLKASEGVLQIENITSTSGVDITIVCSGTNGLQVDLTGAAQLTGQSGNITISTSSTTATLIISKTTSNVGYIKTITIAPKSGSVTPEPEVVNWSIKGDVTTTPLLNNGTTTMPNDPTGGDALCGTKTFVGWSNAEVTDGNKPTILFKKEDGIPNTINLTNGTTFYAVYADTRETTSITYTWDLVQQSTDPALAVGDQIVIAAKDYNYALSTKQNRDDRDAVEITKHATGDSITINEDVQIITLQKWDASDERFALSVGTSQYLSGANEKFTTSANNSNNTNWYIGFNSENSPYIHTQVEEGKKNNKKVNEYYIQYSSFFGIYHSFDVSKNNDPENISIYRRTKHENTTTVNSGYTTDCGCSAPAYSLAFNNQTTITANQTLTLEPNTGTGNGGAITYTCSDATHTTIDGDQFSANALDTYTITATQGVNGSECGAIVDFEVIVECATPSITPTTYETTINTPVDLKSIITSTSTMPLTFACTDENVYISGTNFTFLAADDYTITATQEAGGIYCDGSQEITITVSDPCASKIKPSVTATAEETTITVEWNALDGATAYRVYNNTTGDSDETTETSYTFRELNPSTEYSWTVEAVYSDDDCTAATSGTNTTSTPVVKYTVNWNVAGSSYGSSTTVNHGEKVSMLPAAPVPATYSCDGKVFVGWSKSQFVDGTRPADLFTTVAGSPAITAATTFYAVFADCVTSGDTPEDDTQGEWTLVTSSNISTVLTVGTKIFIAAAEENLSLSTTQNSNNRGTASITKSGNTATIDESTQVLTLEAGTKSGTWAFNTGSGYLYAASSSSNYLRTKAELDANGSWTISVTNTGIATIKAQGSNTRNWLRKNSNSALFSCYSSGQDNVVIYYKSAESTPVDPTEYTVTLSVLGNIEGTPTTTGEYTLPSTVSGTCAGKTFVGWTTTANLSSSTEPSEDYFEKGTPVIVSADVTLYAVFAEENVDGENYVLTENIESGLDYIIAGSDDYALKNEIYYTGGKRDQMTTEFISTINDPTLGWIVNQVPSTNIIWRIDGNATDGYTFYNAAINKYMGMKDSYDDSDMLLEDVSTTKYTIEFLDAETSKATITAIGFSASYKYLSYYNQYFNAYSTPNTYYIYKKVSGTTYSNFSTTCESGDPETTYTVSFNAGTGTCTTQSLKETSEGAGVTLPTATGCGDWTFAGWATASVTETTTAPTLLDAGDNYNPTSNTTLYAVYSKTESGGGEELSQTLQYDSWSYGGSTTDKGTSSPPYRLFHSGGYVQSASFDLSTLTKVVVYGGTYGGNEYNQLTIGDGTNTWKSVAVEGNSQTRTNTYTDGTTLSGMGRLRVTSNSGTSSSSGVRISKIEIYTTSGGSSTTYYNSNPDCESGGDTGGDSGEELTEIITKDNFANSNSTSERSYTAISATWVWQENDVENYDINTTYEQIRLYAGHSMTITPKSGYSISRIVATCTSNDYANKLAGEGLLGATKEVSSSTVTITPISSPIVITQGGQSRVAQFEVYYTSTPASAPARKVAMKKAAAVRVEKSEMVTRPIVKAPAALAEQACTSYENYTTICCTNPITDFKYSAGANSITLYWTTAAPSATATLYSDEACTDQEGEAQTSTSGTCTFTGLAKTTTYYAKVTTGDGCTAVLEVSTERPHVSVAEWAATRINIDVNTNEPIVVVLENEVTSGSQTGNQATELFFSKYYEATANVKLVAVYNGTTKAINLTNYTIKYGKTAWATNYIPLAEFATTANGFALEGHLSPGEEMILYTKNVSDSRDVAIMDCVTEAYPDGKWIEVTTTNNTGSGSLSFGGDKVIALFDGGDLIDIIGAGNTSAPTISGSSMTKPSWGDAKGWTCDEGLSIDDGTMIGISTNRCLLVRNNTVTSGENAVSQNTSDFVTLCTEWKGAHVPDDDIDDGVAASCENFAFVGTFDYSDYYVKYENLATSEELSTEGRLSDGTYAVTTPNLHDIACTNMRISLKDTYGNILVTQDLKVPIIVDKDISTNDDIYFQYPQRTDVNEKPDLGDKNENILTPEICADCDVVIRDSKQLTHVAEGVSEFNNMMIYPGAKFDNSTSQEFYLNTLQMQAKNDEVSYAIINNDGSTIDVGDMVFVKRIDDKHWYQFSLPYDCKVSDIIQQDGQSMGKYWVDWGIKYYNGKLRQEEGTAAEAGQVSTYWEKVEETATLKAHQGYIIGLFTTEWNNQMKFVYFTPVTTNPYRESGDDAKTTQVESWHTDNLRDVAPRHRGWNYTGSPYISIFNPSILNPPTPPYYGASSVLMSGTFDPANPDAAYISGDVYLSIPVLPDGLYYNQVVASSTSLMPFRAYFVQTIDPESADEQHTLTYAKDGRQFPPASAPARTAATKQRVLVELNITAPDGQTDNTGVWVDERYTTDYEIAADLTKMYVAGTKPQLYTLAANNEKLAYNALPDDAATNVPIELYAPLAGDYTLTLNNRVSRIAGAESIELLHDGQVVANLLIQDYTIAAPKGTVKGYSLRIHRRADVSTALDNTTGSTITLIANDGYITLLNVPTDATISIYDMVGRLIDSQHANGETVVNMPIVPQGVYNIVVANGEGHTTIKSVIR